MAVRFTGVNLAGLEFGDHASGSLGTNYVSNGQANYDYWDDAGANTIRLPFAWERLQHEMSGELDADYLQLLHDAVASARQNGQLVILDLHNYSRYFDQHMNTGSTALVDAFADVWARLAAEFKDEPNVWFGLMNEPYEISAADWMVYAQKAADAIRDAGAENKILVSTVDWSGADRFNGDADAATLLAYQSFFDKGENFAFEVHQYLDPEGSGAGGTVDGKGAAVLAGVTEWARQHGYEIFVGEFGVSAGGSDADEYRDFLNFMDQNSDVVLGWTAWGAGEWWSEAYHYYLGSKDESGTDLLDDYFNREPVDFGYSPVGAISDPHNLLGTRGSDTLEGTWQDDVLRGGRGNDLLFGSAGSDIYVYASGDGDDFLDDEAGFTDNLDVLRLVDLNARDISAMRSGVDLLVTDLKTGQTITVDEQYYSNTLFWGIEQIRFADGATWDRAILDAIGSLPGRSFTVSIGDNGGNTMDGTWGDDIIRGGKGNDRLQGSAGSDIYVYTSGDGNDTVDDHAGFTDNIDILRLTDLTVSDVSARREGEHLLIEDLRSGAIITLDEQYRSDTEFWGVEEIRFADGTIWDRDRLDAIGSPFGDPLSAMIGTARSETMDGTWNDDIMRGILGNDRLQGSAGSDTYLYASGDGNDLIDDEAGFTDNTDVLDLTDLRVADISAKRQGLDLVITDLKTGQTITVDEQYYSDTEYWGIEQVRFADGTVWNRAKLDSIGSPYGDPFAAILGTGAADTLQGTWGNDTIRGIGGADRLLGSAGSDTYIFAAGDGNDTISDLVGFTDNTDILRLADLDADQISLERDGNDLRIRIATTGESILIEEQFHSPTESWGIDRIQFADGTLLDRDTILQSLVADGAASGSALVL